MPFVVYGLSDSFKLLQDLRYTDGTKVTVHAIEHNKQIIGAEVQIFGSNMNNISLETSKKDLLVLEYDQGIPEPKVCWKNKKNKEIIVFSWN